MSVRHLNDHVNGKYLDKESFIFVCTCACLIVFNTHAPMFYILLHRSRRVENNFIIPRDFDTSIAGKPKPTIACWFTTTHRLLWLFTFSNHHHHHFFLPQPPPPPPPAYGPKSGSSYSERIMKDYRYGKFTAKPLAKKRKPNDQKVQSIVDQGWDEIETTRMLSACDMNVDHALALLEYN